MSEVDVILRFIAFMLFALSLYMGQLLSGRSFDNIPFWNGLGMLVLYMCYCLSGIHFNNGVSGVAELIVAALVVTSISSFAVGERFVFNRSSRKHFSLKTCSDTASYYIPPISMSYLSVQFIISIFFYLILTHAQPLRLFNDGVGLKFERLQGIAEKSPFLLNLDAFVLAMTLVGFAWAIMSYKDNRRSQFTLGVSVFLMLLYVLSTGSRTPLIGVFLQMLPAMSLARLRSRHMALLSHKKWFFFLALFSGIAFMIVTTGARMKFENLSDIVFYSYFDVFDFGFLTNLLETGEALPFLLATAVTYAASTFNNIVVRFQELGEITLSVGYKFVFFYVAAFQILLPDVLAQYALEWRDLATINKQHLESVSMAAGQWSTPYGDLIWDFGIVGTFIIVAFVGLFLGQIIRNSRRNQNFQNLLLKVMVIGFSLSPLVNPFLSLYVHYILFIVILLTYWSSWRRSLLFFKKKGTPE